MLQIQQLAASASVKTDEKGGLSAGVAIMWRSSMSMSRVPEDWYSGLLAGAESKSKGGCCHSQM